MTQTTDSHADEASQSAEDAPQAAWEADRRHLKTLTDEELRAERDRRMQAVAMAELELGSRRYDEQQRLLTLNPWQVGDWVTTARARRNYVVREVMPRSVSVCTGDRSFETIPLDRVRPAEDSRPDADVSERTIAYLMGVRERDAQRRAAQEATA